MNTYCMIIFIYNSRACKLIHSNRKWVGVYQKWEWIRGYIRKITRDKRKFGGVVSIFIILTLMIVS